MMRERNVLYLLFLVSLYGCLSGPKSKNPSDSAVGLKQNIASTGYRIQNSGAVQKLTVIDPWQKSSDNQFDYFLLERGTIVPTELKEKHIFFTPLQRVVCLSTTHIGYLDALNELGTIVGISGSAYLTNPEVKMGISENRIHEVGYERGLNYELIIQLKPDVVFAYGVGSEINTQINKLHDLGIPVVLVGEYLEQSPLAKAEWIKFFGPFFRKGRQANDVFDHIKAKYDSTKATVSHIADHPAVLTGLPFKDTWWMAGGQSNLAVLISDAGGKFLWSENSSKEAFPVSLEEVFLRASRADYWINCGTVQSKEELMAFDQRFSELPAVKKSNVYNNNLRSTDGGGNDYWESGVVHPDLILQDLVNILHPEINPVKKFYYFRKIE